MTTKNLGLERSKRAALADLLKRHRVPDTTDIPRRARSLQPGLSFAQERLWLLDQFGVGAAYNIPLALRLEGRLQLEVLRSSLSELVCRHESLRTRFAHGAHSPVQVIDPPRPFALDVHDLSGMQQEARAQEVAFRIQRNIETPFDLQQEPPFRAALLRLHETEHVLLLCMHHIVSDGWSIGVFLRELCVIYKSLAEGGVPTLPQPSVQYADFALWQRATLGEKLGHLEQYWCDQLEGAAHVLELPLDHARPLVPSFKGRVHSFAIPAELTAGLKQVCRQHDATLFMVLLAAYGILLSRLSGQDDLLVGTPIAGRSHWQTQDLIGFFVNTIALRLRPHRKMSFGAYLNEVKRTALDGYAHQDYPFEKLVRAVQPERDLSRHPLVQVHLALQNIPQEQFNLPGLLVRPLAGEWTMAQTDLSLILRQSSGGNLYGAFEYATELFNAATIARMEHQLLRVLSQIVERPQAGLGEFSLLQADDARKLLVEWNDSARVIEGPLLLHTLVEEQARLRPDAVALAIGGAVLSYAELNTRSNRLARYLLACGAGPRSPVGLHLERSAELYIGLLAILKAGTAYVPIDPAHPPAHCRFMLDDSRASLVLTDSRLWAAMGDAACWAEACLIDEIDTDACGSSDLATDRHPSTMATCLYTSGSTGKPKAVCVTHVGIVNYAAYVRRTVGLGVGDRVLQFSSIGFDVSAGEMFSAWSSGAALVPQPDKVLPPHAFSNFLREQRISFVDLPVAYWSTWVDEILHGRAEWPEGLRAVTVGGERLTAEQYARWTRLPASATVQLIHSYGPTETAIGSAALVMTGGTRQEPISIGRPIDNTRIYILDRGLDPVPVGVTGELYIGGLGLALGYLNRPGLTAERFIADPFSSTPGARLYRTGDLARYLVDGNIEFVGRTDEQVKIRGFRVELGEVDAAMLALPCVQAALTVVVSDGPRRHLVGYLVPQGAAQLEADALRALLLERLPDYMVPAALVVLERFPLNANGKVDRKMLPAQLVRAEPVAPRNNREAELARVWSEILGICEPGVHDNFFELGGDSLLAMRIIGQVRTRFDVELSLNALFECQTLAQLSERIETISLLAQRDAPPPNTVVEEMESGFV